MITRLSFGAGHDSTAILYKKTFITNTNFKYLIMNSTQILRGHNCLENAYKINDYPYGYSLRTSIFYWIESKKGKGDRFCSCTINPKTGKCNQPKYSTYKTFMYLYLNENGHVKNSGLIVYDLTEFEKRFDRLVTMIGVKNFSDIQQENIRKSYHDCVNANAVYEIHCYSDHKRNDYRNWLKGKLNHILSCDFINLTAYTPMCPPTDKATTIIN